MATVRIVDDELRIDIHGLDRLWTLKSQLTIPLAHVRGASLDPKVVTDPKGWRGPGTRLHNVITAGTFHKGGNRVFWDVHDTDRAIVIELHDERYQRLVVEVDDPRETVAMIDSAVAGR